MPRGNSEAIAEKATQTKKNPLRKNTRPELTTPTATPAPEPAA